MTNETAKHEHHWLDDLRKYRWCMECLHKEIRLDIGCEIWVPLVYGDALFDLKVDLVTARDHARLLAVALESARWQASLSTMPFAQKIVRDLSAALAAYHADNPEPVGDPGVA